jgi:hypothetical protein
VKTFAVISIVLSSLLIVAWPLFFFFSIFIFDAPTHGAADTGRWVFAFWIWSYPWGYLAAIGYLFARRKDRPWWNPPTAYLFLLPCAHLLLLFTDAKVFGVVKTSETH